MSRKKMLKAIKEFAQSTPRKISTARGVSTPDLGVMDRRKKRK